jgi:hypothetical protein
MDYETFCREGFRFALDTCKDTPENAKTFYYEPAKHLARYLRTELYGKGFLDREAEIAYLEYDGKEDFETLRGHLENTYLKSLALLTIHTQQMEDIRAATEPDLPYPEEEGVESQNGYTVEQWQSNRISPSFSMWGHDRLGVSAGDIDGTLSQVSSGILRHGNSKLNFQVMHIVLREWSKQFIDNPWDGSRSVLYLQDCCIDEEDREQGFSERQFLAELNEIASRNGCEMIVDMDDWARPDQAQIH